MVYQSIVQQRIVKPDFIDGKDKDCSPDNNSDGEVKISVGILPTMSNEERRRMKS